MAERGAIGERPVRVDDGNPLRILVVRPDRIGDVVLSTPAFEVIHRHYPNARITAMVRDTVAPLIRGLPSIHDLIIYDPQHRHRGVMGVFRLWRALRKRKFQIAVVLQGGFRVGLALWLSGVRYRIGPLSKFYSFVFYNRGMRQHRSQVEMHEADYNIQLLRRLGIRAGTRSVEPNVHVSEAVREEARTWLESQGWRPTEQLVAIHPGMGGSALNWPEDHYRDLARALANEDGIRVVMTGGEHERSLVERIQQSIGPCKHPVLVYLGSAAQGVDFLAGVLSHCSVVVAPSTGPLHIASALGLRLVTFYPPIRVQSALRWGPYVRDESRASVLVPEVYCGEDFQCRGVMCNYFPCMKSLVVPQALEEVHRQLEAHASSEGTR